MRYGQTTFPDHSGVKSVFHWDTPDRYKLGWTLETGDAENNKRPTVVSGSVGTRPGPFNETYGAVNFTEGSVTNVFTDHSFATVPTTWSIPGGSTLDSIAQDSDVWLWNPLSLKLTTASAVATTDFAESTKYAFSGGVYFAAQIACKAPLGSYPVNRAPRLYVIQYNSSDVEVASSTVEWPMNQLLDGRWHWNWVKGVTNASCAKIAFRVEMGLQTGEAGTIWLDGANLTQTNKLYPYIGGTSSSSALKYNTADIYPTGAQGSMGLWVLQTDPQNGYNKTIFDTRDFSNLGAPFARINTTGKVEWYCQSALRVQTGTPYLRPFNWDHLVFTWDFTADIYNIYINRELRATYTNALAQPTTATTFTFGTTYSGADYFNGYYGDMVFLDRVATPNDIDNMFYNFYSTGPKYGDIEYSDKITWGLDIDWDGDGNYSGDNDAFYMIDLSTRRGREYSIQSDGQGFQPVRTGEFRATLRNPNGLYDPWETTSPLYPYVRPGPLFRLRARDDNTGIIHSVMRGRIEEIRPNFAETVDQVQISGSERFNELKNATAYLDTQLGASTESAMQLVLNQMSWTDGFEYENVPESIPYFWSSGETVWKNLQELADSSLGVVFIAADGKVKFYSRYHSVFGNPLFTIGNTDILKKYSLNVPWDSLRNVVRVKSNNRTPKFGLPLWQATEVFSVSAGGSLSIWVDYTHNAIPCAGKDILQPDQYTDYTANTSSDGLGTDLTTQVSVTLTSYGDRGVLAFTNSSGSTAYITLAKIRGTALTLDNVVSIETTDPTSIALMGRREFRLDNPWVQNINLAKSFTAFLLTYMPEFQKLPSISLIGKPHLQLSPELFDEITLDANSLSGDFLVGQIEHNWIDTLGKVIHTTFRTEPALPFAQYWQFETTLGVSSIFAY